MLRRVDLRGAVDPRHSAASMADLRRRLPRPAVVDEPPVEAVAALCNAVRDGGDGAVRDITRRFDGCDLAALVVGREECEAALEELDANLRNALDVASRRIAEFHQHTLVPEASWSEGGVTVQSLPRAVDRAGAYVPGGATPLISSVLMTAIPAKVAGVGEVVVATAPGPDGRPAAGILAAAALAGVEEVLVGNSTALVAAMAYGTESIDRVDVIVGPGGRYTAQAKREVAARGLVGVPASFAGPSEVVVIADEHALPDHAAVDLIVQIEHGPDGLAWLVCWSEEVASAVESMVEKLAATAGRSDVIMRNLAENAYTAIVDGPYEAVAVANAIAPEHLQLMVEDPAALLDRVHHAGAVFCGDLSPASLGDYVAGPSHVLPTFGSARFAGALGVADFQRRMHSVVVDRAGLDSLAPAVITLAEAEGLGVHAKSIRMRGGE
ncbi:MAG TPA: histidinol dehydrogenase [Acidimicrobiales bacterium]|nr:histidinol dehydrogenase [Acidimicrobiales bacterium]